MKGENLKKKMSDKMDHTVLSNFTENDIILAGYGFFLYDSQNIQVNDYTVPILIYVRSQVACIEINDKSIVVTPSIETLKDMEKKINHIENTIIYDVSQNAIGIDEPYSDTKWLLPKELLAIYLKATDLGYSDYALE